MNIKRRVPLFTALLLGFLLGKVCGSSPKVFIPGEQPYGLDSHGPAKSFDEIAHALEGDIIKTSTPRILRKDAGRSDSEIFNTRRFRFSQDFFCPRSQSSINPCGQLSSEESIGAPWAVHGHLIRVADATSVQINPPKNPEGCGFGDHRATVQETAKAYDCDVAINAGFFDTGNGKCLGNIISNGNVINKNGPHNVNFGVRASGAVSIGYFNTSIIEDLSDPFVQLVAGVLWLVKDGKSFVNQSYELEYKDTQSGSLIDFVRLKSARVAIGYKGDEVRIVQVDGKSNFRGLDLFEFADLLIELGFEQAINLDGGGSATVVVHGAVVSDSSEDLCGSSEMNSERLKRVCERPVTSVVCIKKALDSSTTSSTSITTSTTDTFTSTTISSSTSFSSQTSSLSDTTTSSTTTAMSHVDVNDECFLKKDTRILPVSVSLGILLGGSILANVYFICRGRPGYRYNIVNREVPLLEMTPGPYDQLDDNENDFL
eukprot:m.221696 g.221696  ORF g.221696 m.221696 type:complete len:486 (-) comp15928_c0_seq33:607-2064(-)